jgi:hypothetical protein
LTTEPERLTWDEICARYVDEWVVLVDTDWVNDTDFDFRATTVFGHAKTRKESVAVVKEASLTHKGIGCFFTGPLFGPDPIR